MRTLAAATLVFSLAATPVIAAEGRIRIENSGAGGQVSIVLSDESVHTVEISVPGVISGEMVTVEAPAPQVQLGGGSFDGDPLLEAAIQRKMRESSSRPSTVSVLPAPPRFQPESQRYLNHVFTDVGFAVGGAWSLPYSYGAPVSTTRQRCEARPLPRPSSRTFQASRSARTSHSARAKMPRYR